MSIVSIAFVDYERVTSINARPDYTTV